MVSILKEMNKDTSVQLSYWKQSAQRHWEVAQDLFRTNHRDACLFFCHLTLEKILKAIFLKRTKKTPPYIHDLAKLAALAKVKLSQEQVQDLRTITTFNIAARYDEVKFQFYKKCTPAFTKRYFSLTKTFYNDFKKIA